MGISVENKKASIRHATERDLDALVLLLRQLFEIEVDFEVDAERQRHGLKMLLGNAACRILVAEFCGQVIGMCTLQVVISTAMGGAVGIIEDVVVARPFRRQGMGKRLMEAIEREAWQQGLQRIQLLADVTNPAAAKFYRGLRWQSTSLQAFCKLRKSLYIENKI